MSTRPVAPFSTILRGKLKQPQFYWFLSHGLSVYYYIHYMLSFRGDAVRTNYRKVLLCTVIGYGIVLHQYVRSKQLRFEVGNLKKQVRHLDNLQYFLLALVLMLCSWVGGSPVPRSLSSIVIYSLFHALNYFNQNILVYLPLNPILKTSLSNRITAFTTQYNEPFFYGALVSEFIAMVAVYLALPSNMFSLLFTFNSGSLATLFSFWTYAVFFKLRYNDTEKLRILCRDNGLRADNAVATRFPMLMTKWMGIKHLITALFDRIPA